MHTAPQLDVTLFEVTRGGWRLPPEDALPGWTPSDRVGIVVDEPYGALGASLLVQLAIAQFYAVAPARRGEAPQYPEVYAFHLGVAHCDLSQFDFWPPRKEVVVRDDDDLLGAINDRAISRLIIPDRAQAPRSAQLYWADVMAARERITQTVAYVPGGHVAGGDLVLRGPADRLEANSVQALELHDRLEAIVQLSPAERLARTPGPVTSAEVEAALHYFKDRLETQSIGAAGKARELRAELGRGQVAAQTYKSVELADGLQLLGVDAERAIRPGWTSATGSTTRRRDAR